jgi:hypothetical protein
MHIALFVTHYDVHSIKVRKSRKQIIVSSILPKNEQKIKNSTSGIIVLSGRFFSFCHVRFLNRADHINMRKERKINKYAFCKPNASLPYSHGGI